MNKKLLFKICLIAALTASAGSAYANTAITGTMTIGGGTYSPSKAVTVNVISSTTNYAAISGHLNGDRSVGTNNLDPKMYYTAKATGATASEPGSETEPFSGWTSL